MKNRAIINKAGVVVNKTFAPSNFTIPDHIIIDIDEATVSVGDSYINGKFVSKAVPKLTADQLKAILAEARYNFEISGVEWNGQKVDTTREAQSMITGMVLMAQLNKNVKIKFKTKSGFFPIDINGIGGLANTVGQHVQKAFAIEADGVEAIDAGKITTHVQIKKLFKGD